jgi:DNA-binding NtrC family response regulator
MMKQSRILVVDDEPGMLRAVERVLSGTHRIIGTGIVESMRSPSRPTSNLNSPIPISACRNLMV